MINFVYSLPQLVGIVFCPRHRLPRFNTETKLLEGIPTNLNLVNLTLLITGPLSERTLCLVLLAFQVVSWVYRRGREGGRERERERESERERERERGGESERERESESERESEREKEKETKRYRTRQMERQREREEERKRETE